MIRNDEGAGRLFALGVIGGIVLVYMVWNYGLMWAWNNVMVADTLGSAVGYGIALVVMVSITLYAVVFAIVLPIIGAFE